MWMLDRHDGSRQFWHVNLTQMPWAGKPNRFGQTWHLLNRAHNHIKTSKPLTVKKRYGQGGLSGDQVRPMIQMIMCPSFLWLRIEGGRPLALIIWVSGPGAGGPTCRGSTSQTNADTHRHLDLKGSKLMMMPCLIK